MARSSGVSVQNSFVKGLITEATGLNFPEDAATDTDNCIFERLGNVTRRLGIELEEGAVANVQDLDGSAISEYLWKAAALNGEIVFLVVQVGINLSFYRLTEAASLSSNLQNFSASLDDFKVPGSPDVGSTPCSMAAGNGVLFVVHPYCEPFYIEYDPVANDITSTEITIKIRDMRGVDQSDVVPEYNNRPTVAQATDAVRYNLLNQGWAAQTRWASSSSLINFNLEQQVFNGGLGITPIGTFSFPGVPAIDAWFLDGAPLTPGINGQLWTRNSHTTVYPSEAEAWWFYKYPGAVIPFFDVSAGNDIFPLNAPAAKGHFVYNAFNINRGATAMAEYILNGGTRFGSLTVEGETSGYYRPGQVAFFAGRAFYAGVAATGYSTRIYFTKVTETKVDYGKCHQQLDPTGEEGGDLIASDGGVLIIPEMAQVIKLFTSGANLFVFATNGIWKIAGGLGNTTFAANAYAVSRISTINALSPLNFVDMDGMPIWWNNDGIWTLKTDQLGTSVQVDTLSLSTISSFVEAISATNKRFVKGAFNPFTRIVQWIYRSDLATTIEEQYQYDRILNYDTMTKAFYPWSLPAEAETRITGIFVPQGTTTSNVLEVVTVNGVTVTVNAEDVTVNRPIAASLTSIFKYIVLANP